MSQLFILSTLICLVDIFASMIIKFVTTWSYLESGEDQTICKELIALKKEMGSISMVDEFAKYTKLQRKYLKLEGEAKEKMNVKSVSRMKLKLTLTYGTRILNGIFTSMLIFFYRREPVIVFPSGYLWPLESFLSWPTTVDNCISLPTWIILMKSSISTYKLYSN